MNLYLFKYCLPLLLGYVLFAGLSGRINPLLKPEYPEERPSWFLGVWTGLSVAIVMLVGTQMAYSMSVEGVRALLLPTALFMAVLLAPGFLVYLNYRREMASDLQISRSNRVNREKLKTKARDTVNRLDALSPELVDFANDATQQAPDSNNPAQDTMINPDTNAPIVAAFLDSADLQILDNQQQEAANNEKLRSEPDTQAAEDSAQDDLLDETIFEECHYSLLDLDAQSLADLSLTDALSAIEADDFVAKTATDSSPGSWPESADTDNPDPLSNMNAIEDSFEELSWEIVSNLPTLPEFEFDLAADYDEELLFGPEDFETIEENRHRAEDQAAVAAEPTSPEPVQTESSEQSRDLGNPVTFIAELEFLASDLQMDDEPEAVDSEDITRMAEAAADPSLQKHLEDERSAHEKTARQLYATHKVLATLTSGAEGSESEVTISFLQMKEELTQNRNRLAIMETDMQLETSHRKDLESVIEELKKDLVSSKHDVRRGTAARAKALSTANKAIAFARQTLQVRAQLEEDLEQARETLSRRQDTISSLIRELEQEKERTQEEVSFMVQQLVQHEQQLKARRNQKSSSDDAFDANLTTHTQRQTETPTLSSGM